MASTDHKDGVFTGIRIVTIYNPNQQVRTQIDIELSLMFEIDGGNKGGGDAHSTSFLKI
jgi:hypothetical protein